MDVLIHSDGQLYPPRRQEKPKPPPPPKPTPKPELAPTPELKPEPEPDRDCDRDRRPPAEIPWEDLLLIGVAFLLLRNTEKPDLPLLLALAYILFDQPFDLKKLL